jgi:hypothetical protein
MLLAYEPPLFLASWLELLFAVAEQAAFFGGISHQGA